MDAPEARDVSFSGINLLSGFKTQNMWTPYRAERQELDKSHENGLYESIGCRSSLHKVGIGSDLQRARVCA